MVPAVMDVAASAAKRAGIPQHPILPLEGKSDGFMSTNHFSLLANHSGEIGYISSFKILNGKKNRHLCAFLSFSSVTIGLPKAVIMA